MKCLRYSLYLSTTIAFENHLCAEHSQFKKSVSQYKESDIDTIGDYVAAWYVHQKLNNEKRLTSLRLRSLLP